MDRAERKSKIISYILMHATDRYSNDTKELSELFGVTTQTISRYFDELKAEGAIEAEGRGKGKKYRLAIKKNVYIYDIDKIEKDEYSIWLEIKKDFLFLNDEGKNNIYSILQYGFTEIVNNVFDHSSAKKMTIITRTSSKHCEVIVADDGIGIFKKIKEDFNLEDIRHSILELAKGKLTSDEKRHSGEGIFFSSKMFDIFWIVSDDLYFRHDSSDVKDYLHDTEAIGINKGGTIVLMKICNDSNLTSKEVFDQFAGPDEFTFSKTVIPVELMQIDSDQLISRSQAKRLIIRFDRFKEVILNFDNVDMIGQAFSDQVFRVFANDNPDVELHVTNANKSVMQMIERAKSH